MKLKLVAVLLIVIGLSGCAQFSAKETQLAVQELVAQVQVAVNKIKENTDASSVLPPLKSAELTISSKAVQDKDGKISLLLSAEGGKKETDANYKNIEQD